METKKLLSEHVITDLKDYMLAPYGFILMVGKNGRGKSHAAMEVYKAIATYKLPAWDPDEAWFINQADLNMEFSDRNGNDSSGSSMLLLKQAQKVKFLVIDDLGTRTPTPAFMDFLYAIIDKRWRERHQLGTIITTNLDSTRLRKEMGEPIFSRIASGRNYVVIGDDRRFTDLGF